MLCLSALPVLSRETDELLDTHRCKRAETIVTNVVLFYLCNMAAMNASGESGAILFFSNSSKSPSSGVCGEKKVGPIFLVRAKAWHIG
jgi:hypothetical protein